MKFRVSFFWLFMLFSSLNALELAIAWDFGGTLFRPSYIGVGSKVGFQHFLKYMIMDFKSPNIQQELFKFLDTIMEDDKKFGAVGSGDGMTLPTIMRHWQAGTILGPKIIKMAHEHIKKMDKLGYFCSRYEKELYERVIAAMFDPKILANNIYPVEEGIKLLKKCVAAKNPDGTKKNKNYGWSNMDPLSYKLSKEMYPEIFALFDGVFVSGEENVVKPDREFYELGLKKFGLNPKNCLLIDDQEINAKSARECNIGTLVLKSLNSSDFKVLEQQLKLCGAL